MGRFLSVDPLSPDFPWYTPYQYAGNKPVWAVDLDGLEDVIYQQLENYSTEHQKTAEEAEQLAGVISIQAPLIEAQQKLLDKYEGFSLLQFFGNWINKGIGAASAADAEASGAYEAFEKNVAGFNDLVDQYNAKVQYIEEIELAASTLLGDSKTLTFSGGVTLDRIVDNGNQTTAAAVALHGNSHSVNSNLVLYEIEINGQHYKYGITNSDAVTTRDIEAKGPKGYKQTIPAGTPKRVATQLRRGIKSYGASNFTLHSQRNNVNRRVFERLESNAIINGATTRGYIGDGNSKHHGRAKKRGITNLGKFRPKL